MRESHQCGIYNVNSVILVKSDMGIKGTDE